MLSPSTKKLKNRIRKRHDKKKEPTKKEEM